ncbi:MAG: sigma-70 family RNA polymerase sigma factor [Patescibacteria group bacterium]
MKDEILLVQKAKNGDNKAFGDLYDYYLPKIYRFIFLKIGGRKQDAEDISHHVFTQAWENMSKFEFQGFPFGSWLYRIASNAVIDYYRTFKNHFDIDETAQETLARDSGFENRIDTAFDIELAKTAISKLEHDQQNVVIMKFIDELSTKEIAQALGKTEGAIRVIQHRALKQIKSHIDASRNNPTIKEA